MDVEPWVWWTTIAVTSAVLLFDVVIIGRRPHTPSMKECSIYLAGYIGLALLFGLGVYVTSGSQYGTEFLAGWLTEYSLSVDNLFIFIIILGKFSVPKKYQQTALMIGIVLALIMRGIFIAVGAAAINNFSLDLLPLRAVPALDRVRSWPRRAPRTRTTTRRTSSSSGPSSTCRRPRSGTATSCSPGSNGKRVITPMFLVVLTLGTTDLLFALDSIPAIYGLTNEPYLVLTANIFALMGLRQLYFLIGGLLERLIYLSYGLAFLLGFIGVKLVFHAMHENELPFINGGEPIPWAPEIPIWLSLGVIVLTLVVTTVWSLAASRKMTREELDARTGPRRDWEDDS